MSIRSVILATTILATASGYAFAQSSYSPAAQSNPKVEQSGQSTTNQAQDADNVKSRPNRAARTMRAPAETTGFGASPQQESQEKNLSPADPEGGGIEREK